MANIKKREVIEVMDSDDTPEMDRIIGRLDDLRTYTWNISEKAKRITNRFFNENDEDQELYDADDEPHGIIGKLDRKISILRDIARSLEKSLEKLSTL